MGRSGSRIGSVGALLVMRISGTVVPILHDFPRRGAHRNDRGVNGRIPRPQ
jgi:hypothetical protein